MIDERPGSPDQRRPSRPMLDSSNAYLRTRNKHTRSVNGKPRDGVHGLLTLVNDNVNSCRCCLYELLNPGRHGIRLSIT